MRQSIHDTALRRLAYGPPLGASSPRWLRLQAGGCAILLAAVVWEVFVFIPFLSSVGSEWFVFTAAALAQVTVAIGIALLTWSDADLLWADHTRPSRWAARVGAIVWIYPWLLYAVAQTYDVLICMAELIGILSLGIATFAGLQYLRLLTLRVRSHSLARQASVLSVLLSVAVVYFIFFHWRSRNASPMPLLGVPGLLYELAAAPEHATLGILAISCLTLWSIALVAWTGAQCVIALAEVSRRGAARSVP